MTPISTYSGVGRRIGLSVPVSLDRGGERTSAERLLSGVAAGRVDTSLAREIEHGWGAVSRASMS